MADKGSLKKEHDYTVVYVTKVQNGNGEATAVWFGVNHPWNVFKIATQGPAATVQACLEAVQIALRNGIRRLMIKTDIPYVYHSMTKWIHKWKENGWQTVRNTDVRHRRDFMMLDRNCQRLDEVAWMLIDEEDECCQGAKILAATVTN